MKPTAALAVLLACFFGFAPPAAAGPKSGDHPKLDRVLNDRAEHAGGGRSRVIVTLKPGWDASAAIKQANGRLGRRLDSINGQVVELPNALIRKLADNPAVESIHWDRPTQGLLNRVAVTVGARAVQFAMGYDGAGIGVAVIDSGVTSWHDDLTYRGSNPRVKVVNGQRVSAFVDFVNGRTSAYDDYGHGTHVSGIIAGNGYDSFGSRAGIAPAADIVSLKVLDGNGNGHISDVIAALDWAVQNKTAYNIRVVNLSVGAPVTESYNTDPLAQAAKHAVQAGIVVVAAAGNIGQVNGKAVYGAITAPGNAPWVLTVGAYSHNGTIWRFDDTMAPYSSRGPTMFDRLAKPDLVAPGTGTASLAAPGSTLYKADAGYLLNGSFSLSNKPYLSLTGTSMAAPVVAGTVALMLQANPSLTPNAVKAILEFTAQSYKGYDYMTEGAGFLDSYGAVQLARYYRYAHAGDRYPSSPTWSHHIVWGNHLLTNGVIAPRGNAWAANVVWGAAKTDGGDNIVWGTHCSATDPSCDNIVWGTSMRVCDPSDPTCDNIVWGTSLGCSTLDPTCDNIVWGTSLSLDLGGDNIVWGTSLSLDLSLGLGGDNIVWGTSLDGDNIVWGTNCGGSDCGDNIVWGTSLNLGLGGDNIVWGTSVSCDPTDPTCDNIVWGTSVVCDPTDPTCDNIVWGTSDEETPLYDDPDAPPPSFDGVTWDQVVGGGATSTDTTSTDTTSTDTTSSTDTTLSTVTTTTVSTLGSLLGGL
ncbi:MAG TPA: S8 family peptidase [Vicinamibacterales bacterium]|nr:S8 family peptidase [Vicinamibacterales bacterium]